MYYLRVYFWQDLLHSLHQNKLFENPQESSRMVSQTKKSMSKNCGWRCPLRMFSSVLILCVRVCFLSSSIFYFFYFLMFTPCICCATWPRAVFRTSVPQQLTIWSEGCVTEPGMVRQLCSGINTLSRPSSRLGDLMCSWSHWGGNCDHLLSLGERPCDDSKLEGQWLLAETAHLFPGRPIPIITQKLY